MVARAEGRGRRASAVRVDGPHVALDTRCQEQTKGIIISAWLTAEVRREQGWGGFVSFVGCRLPLFYFSSSLSDWCIFEDSL
jgi:hypothetical protein